jgi:hypothetical protein
MQKRAVILVLVLAMVIFMMGAKTSYGKPQWIIKEGLEIEETGEHVLSCLLFFTEPNSHELLREPDVLLVYWELQALGGFRLGDTFAKLREVVVYTDKSPVTTWTNDYYVLQFTVDAWDVPVIQIGVFMVEEGVNSPVSHAMPGRWEWDAYEHHTKGESLFLIEIFQERSIDGNSFVWKFPNRGNQLNCMWLIEHKTFRDIPYLKLSFLP